VERKVGGAEGWEGDAVGEKVGAEEGDAEEEKEGGAEGDAEGLEERGRVGLTLEGVADSVLEGVGVGTVGMRVGLTDGDAVVGLMVLGTGALVGWPEGNMKGWRDGCEVGERTGCEEGLLRGCREG